jgi:hypothetical protein
MAGYNFYGGGSSQVPAAQWGVGNTLNSSSFNFGGDPSTSYNSPSGWGMPDTALGTPSATGGYGGFASSTGANAATPGIFGNTGLGANLPTFQLGLGAIGTLGNLWGAFNAQSLAKDALDFQKNMAQKNLTNSTTSYNTALTDRATARGVTEGQSDAQVQDYINKNKLAG